MNNVDIPKRITYNRIRAQLRLLYVFSVASAIAQVIAEAGEGYERDERQEKDIIDILNIRY